MGGRQAMAWSTWTDTILDQARCNVRSLGLPSGRKVIVSPPVRGRRRGMFVGTRQAAEAVAVSAVGIKRG
jgi:hypothetical protein